MKHTIILLSLFAAIFVLGSGRANAATELDPSIQGEVRLTAAGSPYVASEEGLGVTNHSHLTIDAGVTILFPEYASLYVQNSELSILGTDKNKVLFKGNDGDEWSGIFIDSSKIDVNSLAIENSAYPIDSQKSTTTIHNLYIDGDKNASRSIQYGIHSVKDNLFVSSSTIINFKTAGIYQESGTSTLSWNFISGNQTGVQYKIYSPPVLSKRNIFGKVLAVIMPKRAVADIIDYPLTAENNIIASNIIDAKNLAEDVVLDMRNNFWGSENGPTSQSTSGNILFSPWLKTPSIPETIASCCSNILFIPGFEGSRLTKNSNQLWEPNRNADVKKLYLNGNGQSIDPAIRVGDIIKKTNIGLGVFDRSIYGSFTSFLDGLVSQKTINQWESYPYDWRLDLPLSSSTNLVRNLAKSSLTGKVTLVGHSNGGLMAKKVVDELKRTNDQGLIDSVVLVATPQSGAPSAIGALLHGDDQSLAGGFVLDKATAREFGNNLAGAYNLLPSAAFVANVPLVSFASSTDLSSNLRSIYGSTITAFGSLKNFLLGTLDKRSNPTRSDTEKPAVLNPYLLGNAIAVHGIFDSWDPPEGIKLYQIGGYNIPTSSGVSYYTKTECSLTAGPICISLNSLQHENRKTGLGDGTVPIASSLSSNAESFLIDLGKYDSDKGKTFSHADILEIPPVQETVGNILRHSETMSGDYVTRASGGPVASVASSPVRRYSVHSPVTLDGYDSNGRHVGLAKSPDSLSDLTFIENGVPGATYEEEGTDKYIYVTGNKPLRFEMKGLAGGTFSFDVAESKAGEEPKQLAVFQDIPVEEGTIAKAETSPTTTLPETLTLDMDGNGTVDISIKKNTPLSAVDYLNLLLTDLKRFNLTPQLEQRIEKVISRLIVLIGKGKDERVSNIVKKFYYFLETKNIKAKHISPIDLAELLKLIVSLLDSLENK